MNNNVWIFVWMHVFSILGEELLNYMVTLCLTFGRTPKLFSKLTALFYSHQQWMRVPISPYPWQHLLLSAFSFWAILVGVKWYLVVSIFWQANDVEHLSCAYWSLVFLLCSNVCSNDLSAFNWVVFLLLRCKWYHLYILDTNPLSDMWFFKYVVPFSFGEVPFTDFVLFCPLCFWCYIFKSYCLT